MSARKRIPKLGRWPTNPAAVWKLAAAHYRDIAEFRDKMIRSLAQRLVTRDRRVLALEARVRELEAELSAHKDTVMTLDRYRLKLEAERDAARKTAELARRGLE